MEIRDKERSLIAFSESNLDPTVSGITEILAGNRSLIVISK